MLFNFNLSFINPYINSLYIVRNIYKKISLTKRFKRRKKNRIRHAYVYKLRRFYLTSKLKLLKTLRLFFRHSEKNNSIVFNKNRHLYMFLKRSNSQWLRDQSVSLVNRILRSDRRNGLLPKRNRRRSLRMRIKKRLLKNRFRRKLLRSKFKYKVLSLRFKHKRLYGKYKTKHRSTHYHAYSPHLSIRRKAHRKFQFSYLRHRNKFFKEVVSKKPKRVLNYKSMLRLPYKRIRFSNLILFFDSNARMISMRCPPNSARVKLRIKQRKYAKLVKRNVINKKHYLAGLDYHMLKLRRGMRCNAEKNALLLFPNFEQVKDCILGKKSNTISRMCTSLHTSYLRPLYYTQCSIVKSNYAIRHFWNCLLAARRKHNFVHSMIGYTLNNDVLSSDNSYRNVPLFSYTLSLLLKKHRNYRSRKRKRINRVPNYSDRIINISQLGSTHTYFNPMLCNTAVVKNADLLRSKLTRDRVYVYVNVMRSNIYTTLVRNGRVIFSLWSGLLKYRKRLKVQKDVAYKMGGIFYKKMSRYLIGAKKPSIHLVFNGALRFSKFFANTYFNVLSRYVYRFVRKTRRRVYKRVRRSKNILLHRLQYTKSRIVKYKQICSAKNKKMLTILYKKMMISRTLNFFSILKKYILNLDGLFGNHQSLYSAILYVHRYVINLIRVYLHRTTHHKHIAIRDAASLLSHSQQRLIKEWSNMLSTYITSKDYLLLSQFKNTKQLLLFIKHILKPSYVNKIHSVSSLRCILAYVLITFVLDLYAINRILANVTTYVTNTPYRIFLK